VNTFQAIITNGCIPLIPVLAWNIIWVGKLPQALRPKSYNANIPIFLRRGETAFRVLIFALPIFLKTNISTATGRRGLVIFLIGTIIYFSSWLLQIFAPSTSWSKSIVGFSAPAFTPILWLIGLSLMFHSWYFNFSYHYWHYAIPSIVMTTFHGAHALYVYNRKKSPATRISAAS
jgi:hypothetical protein